ncbi:C39 family peptidase [Meiothermus granaticius]|uniref:Peptidase C39 like family protein n=1 Tax=Meiothermus granaticius NBRC 107808 TaxID=1227551 RepID=A0A399FCM2_9DEIN|nr:C39 family peptidase [Meiothermus granaticius]RIH93475.1 Peptidase C39 like family protein [Meiothermus granaticius NBRC 107808]GEM85969.1 hypothetical protein MGR01S_05940 [Meiothermus granaticius NBRC 107808]
MNDWLKAAMALLPILLLGSLAQPSSVQLQGIRHEHQRLNNCGPVIIGMAMSYWGSTLTQYQTAPVLKPNRADKNVSPDEMAAYARSQGFAVKQGITGDLALLKRLVAAGYPVIAQTWFVSDQGGMGHYRLISGYDDAAGFFWTYDSYNGPNIRPEYREFDRLWRVYNRTYLVVYPSRRQIPVSQLLGQRTGLDWEYRKAAEIARKESQSHPTDDFAWFNLGTSLLWLGDPQGAAAAYDRAWSLPLYTRYDPGRPQNTLGNWPWRTLWYQFGPYQAYFATAVTARCWPSSTTP